MPPRRDRRSHSPCRGMFTYDVVGLGSSDEEMEGAAVTKGEERAAVAREEERAAVASGSTREEGSAVANVDDWRAGLLELLGDDGPSPGEAQRAPEQRTAAEMVCLV